jgi:diphthine-ammonia ligase
MILNFKFAYINDLSISVISAICNTCTFSGGKDSCYNMMQCVANGHEIVALANLKPSKESGKGRYKVRLTNWNGIGTEFSSCKLYKDELDSFMYQTVGHDAIHFYAECMDLPLYRREILGSSLLLTPDYVVTRDDETEDLFCLLQDVMVRQPYQTCC